MLSDDTSVAMPFFQCITRSFKTPTDTCARLANGLVYLPLRRVASLYSPGTMISRGILGIWAAFLSCTPATRRSFTSPLPSLATSPSLKGASPIRNPKPETRNPKPEVVSSFLSPIPTQDLERAASAGYLRHQYHSGYVSE